ncbi:TIGR01459 family HAD-type hydrolase [Chelativorans sp. ZYF759]|nr:TIGR01459 family HAD-type hydrolase [Chelativorans sp. ZYF759]
MSRMIDTLDEIADAYSVILSDVWGVLHNGIAASPEAVAALVRQREQGKTVILITNAPRPHPSVIAQLQSLGVDDEAWDSVITSGDVTRRLIEEGPRKIYHIGPDRDLIIYDGLDVEMVDYPEAGAIVCTGPFNDDVETPDDYAELLPLLRGRNLPFICANPDIVVERGDRLIWCAGALARDYARLGGRTLIAGKPHRPIYEAALAAAAEITGKEVPLDKVLAIGDGVLTDVKGAVDNGFDLLYVTTGIHAHEYAGESGPDPEKLTAFLESHGYRPLASIPRLK